uniref:ZZ-type domain-containing protein n=1 Tax=Oryza brachyantha TaxID=4533 RepID=J3NEY0_ORYBR
MDELGAVAEKPRQRTEYDRDGDGEHGEDDRDDGDGRSGRWEPRRAANAGARGDEAVMQGRRERGVVKVNLEDVLCIFCKEMLLEPCVLNCAHAYCLTCLLSVDEKEIKCQACGAPHPAKPIVCWNLDNFLKHHFCEEYSSRQQRVSYSGTSEKKTGPSKVQSSSLKHTHVGVGCDDCGVFPIQGRRYSCTECVAPGFDLCGECFQKGTSTVGRFDQNHTAEHTMQLDDSFRFPKLLSYLDEKRIGEQQDGSEEEFVLVDEDEVGVVWDDE